MIKEVLVQIIQFDTNVWGNATVNDLIQDAVRKL